MQRSTRDSVRNLRELHTRPIVRSLGKRARSSGWSLIQNWEESPETLLLQRFAFPAAWEVFAWGIERVRRPVSRVLSTPSQANLGGDGWPFLWDARYRAPRATDPGGGAETPRAGCPACRPYLVLLPVGFAVPLALPLARWALTPPFHPYLAGDPSKGAGLAVCSLWHFPWGRPRRSLTGTVSPWSPDFPHPAVTREVQPSSRLTRRPD